MELSARACRLLAAARRDGYLRMVAGEDEACRREWGRWCMAMRVPVVVWRRRSRTARTGRLYVDLCTTPNELRTEGQERLRRVLLRAAPKGEGRVSAVAAEWSRVNARTAGRLAREAYRTVTTLGLYQPDLRRLVARLKSETAGTRRAATA